MSRRFLVPPRLPSGSTNPATGNVGDLWYNTTEGAVFAYDGTAWVRDGLPVGGTTGQIIIKNSNGNYDATWVDQTSIATSTLKHYVKNDSGSTLTKGTVVYTSGANGTNILVKRAKADSEVTSSQVLGFVEADIAVNATGYVINTGLITNINTNGATAGDAVYLSGTTAGAFVMGYSNKPSAPTHLVYLGVVSRANTNTGEIFVRVSNGWELDELHNVSITSPTTGQVLVYDSALGYWKNGSVSSTNIYDYSSLDGGDEASRIELAEITGGWISETADGGTP